MNLKQLRERRGSLEKRARAIVGLAESQDRGLTAEERAEFDRIHAEDTALRDRVASAERLDSLDGELSRPSSTIGRRIGATAAPFSPTGPTTPGSALDSQGHHPAIFRNTATGEVVRGLRHSDRLSNRGFEPQFDEDSKSEGSPPDLGDFLARHLTGRFDADWSRRYANFSTGDGSGGLLLQPDFAAGFIDLARAASVCSKAGAVTVPIKAAEVIFAALASDPVSTWRWPGVTVPSGDGTISRITMHPRTLACVIPVELELIEDASNVGAILAHSLSASMALALDQACLGVVSPAVPEMPIGLLNTPGINTIAVNGTPTNYAPVGEAVTDVLTANFDRDVEELAWCLHPRDGETFDKLVDSLGQPMRPTPLASKLQRFQTTSFPTNQGGGTASTMVVGDFSMMLIGMRTEGVRIRILESGYITDTWGNTFEVASSLQRIVVAYLRADVAILRPSWFTSLTGVTP